MNVKRVKVILRRSLKYGLFTLLVIGAIILGSNRYIIKSTQRATFNSVNDIPYNDVALVLGSRFRTPRGNVNMYFASRMNATVELYKAKKIRHILVSGDNHSNSYDESTDMKNYLISLGIDEADITLDFAGFRTFDSVVRSKEIFGLQKVTIVSQGFHTPRALFLAKSIGLEAVAYNAKSVMGSGVAEKREILARVKALLDIYILNKEPRFLGKKEYINIPKD